MKTLGPSFFPSIEILESRIAPASLLFTDVDGDQVRITVSKGTAGDLAAAAIRVNEGAGEQLRVLNLAINPIFADANVSIDVIGGAGDGKVNVGFIRANGLDLGLVKVDGDLGRIVAGDGNAADGSCTSLRVETMGAFGTDTQGPAGNLQSSFVGKLGALRSIGDLKDVTITVSGGLFNLDGQIGTIDIGGNLVGGATARSGQILARGAIGTAHINGNLLGGDGALSGSIITERTLGSVAVDGQILGGDGERSGRIFAADLLSFARIGETMGGEKIIGGDGLESGTISSFTRLGTIVVNGQITGGSGFTSGAIGSGGAIVNIAVKGDLTGGFGERSGAILATGSIVNATIGSASDGADILGGRGTDSGIVGSSTQILNLTLFGSLAGGLGERSGAIGSLRGLGNIHVTGGVFGGGSVGLDDGGGLGELELGLAPDGGQTFGSQTGRIVSRGIIQNVVIDGDLVGGGTFESGTVGSLRGITSVVIGGNLAGSFAPRSGSIISQGSIQSVHIGGENSKSGGSIRGSFGQDSGAIISFGTIGRVVVEGSIVGGSGDGSGSIQGEDRAAGAGRIGGRINSVFIQGSLQGGSGENSGAIRSRDDIGAVTINGGITGDDGDFSGSVVSGGGLTRILVGGGVRGGDGDLSGIIETDGGFLGTVTIDGDLFGGTGLSSGTVFSAGGIGTLTVGAITGGGGRFSGGVISELNIERLTVNGDVTGSSQDEAGKISAGGRIANLTINGDLVGGAGDFDTTTEESGPIGQISTEAAIVNLTINGGILGGDGARSGQIYAGAIVNGSISGSIIGGAGEGSGALIASRANLQTLDIGGSLTSGRGIGSGTIAAQLNIGSIEIGSVVGSGGTRATISAAGKFLPTNLAQAQSIGSLHVDTIIDGANILAGYGIDGSPINPDAQIGEIVVGDSTDRALLLARAPRGGIIIDEPDSTSLRGTNIVAGVLAGNDGQFGTADDREIGATAGPDEQFFTADDKTIGSRTIISRIAKLVIRGSIGSEDSSETFGIVAQQIVSLDLGGEPVALLAGPGNDSLSLDESGTNLQELGANRSVQGFDVLSTFQDDTDGWTVNNATAVFRPTGGNPSGYLYFDNPETTVSEIIAPAKFLGDLRRFIGGQFFFDGILLQQSGPDFPAHGTVTIVGPSDSVSLDIVPGQPPLNVWQTYGIDLNAATWGRSSTQWTALLSNVTALRITIEAVVGGEQNGVDDVVLLQS